MDYHGYESAGKWFEDARKNDDKPSCAMMHGITQTMKRLGMTFPEAFEFLERNGKIILIGNLYFFQLDYENLFEPQKTNRDNRGR